MGFWELGMDKFFDRKYINLSRAILIVVSIREWEPT